MSTTLKTASDLDHHCFVTLSIQNLVKTDCGFIGVNQETCQDQGCCWNESQIEGEPWCFHSQTAGAVVTTSTVQMDKIFSSTTTTTDNFPVTSEPAVEEINEENYQDNSFFHLFFTLLFL